MLHVKRAAKPFGGGTQYIPGQFDASVLVFDPGTKQVECGTELHLEMPETIRYETRKGEDGADERAIDSAFRDAMQKAYGDANHRMLAQ